ncbi:MAG: DUF4974 domain-containing protein [Tannerella sp.]|nr:DUF4974 domain-containing protein [Tannerella sp.]
MEENRDLTNEEFRQIEEWTETLKLNRETDLDERWSRIESQMHGLRLRTKIFRFLRNAAAILFIPVLLSTLYIFYRSQKTHNENIPQIELTAAYGQVTKITLPDSSEVWLNSGSKISYPQRFTSGRRTVQLEGEAFFKVQADKKRRFDVEIPNELTASAYGTEFNISAYAEDLQTEITLSKGNLTVASAQLQREIDLKPSHQVIYNKTENTLTAKAINLYVETAWKDGKMVFRRTPFSEVVEELSRHFNVDIELKDNELHNYSFSATFTTESIEEILRLFEKSSPIRWKMIEPKQLDNLEFSKRKIIITQKIKSNNPKNQMPMIKKQ